MELSVITGLPVEIEKEIIENGHELFVAGDIFINVSDYSKIARVERIEVPDDIDKSHNKMMSIRVYYREPKDWGCTEWKDERCTDLSQFIRYTVSGGSKLERGKNIADYIEEGKKVCNGEIDIASYSDKQSDNINTSTGLISKSSKQGLIVMQESLQIKKNQVELVKQFAMLEMARRKAELDKIKEGLNGVLQVFEKKIKKIMQVITTIELYLGIDEELFLIQDGEKAPSTTPIHFRQMVLYMDEETGNWKNGGLDFQNVDWFDNWLITDDNYKNLIPEEKGMLVFRPRRYDKNYGANDYYAAAKNQENKYNTYLLIRNGECLYRVYTENIVILPRLFPKRTELEQLLKKVDEEMKSGSFYGKEKAQENVEDMMYQYQKRAVLLQGLIDRTEVFHPLPAEKVNIFNMESLGDKVVFIYDDEEALPSGRKTFNKWREDINKSITKGSRVIVTNHLCETRKNNTDRLYYYCNEYNAPPNPPSGVYEVEIHKVIETQWLREEEFISLKVNWDDKNIPYEIKETDEKKFNDWTFETRDEPRKYFIGYRVKSQFEHLTILYNPQDTVYGGWGSYDSHERKKRIRFRIFPSDKFLLNYDQIDLADIDFYLKSRTDRPNYLSMMPELETIKKFRLEEIESEQAFARLVFDRNFIAFTKSKQTTVPKTEEILYGFINKAIDWWKFKNLWKRPIAKDDAKALRMIESRIQSELKELK